MGFEWEGGEGSEVEYFQVIVEANKALSWLEEKQKVQTSLRKTDEPVLVSGDIKKKQDVLTRFAEPLMSRPAPPPPVTCHPLPRDQGRHLARTLQPWKRNCALFSFVQMALVSELHLALCGWVLLSFRSLVVQDC